MSTDRSSGGISIYSGVPPAELADAGALSGAVVAAAAAIGLSAYGPPIVRSDPTGIAVCLLCREGHIVIHARAQEGRCVVDVFAAPHLPTDKGVAVIERRLGVPR
jgi:S-adenosylmethionine/arginine decarboxylase-like enzyme